MQVQWLPNDFNTIGYLGQMLDDADERPAQAQFNSNYPFGGFQPFPGFRLTADDRLIYPDDPPLRPRAQARLRDELIYLYPSGWVAIIQPDRTFVVARLD